MRRSSSCHLACNKPLLVLALAVLSAVSACANPQVASPFAESRLIILRPSNFLVAGGTSAAKPAAEHYFGQLAAFSDAMSCPVAVKQPGKYFLWVRAVAEKTPRPLTVQLLAGTEARLRGVINDGDGAPGRGGKAAFLAYRNEAMDRGGVNADGTPADPDAGFDGVDEKLLNTLGNQGPTRWIGMARIETIRVDAPAYWWKLGPVELSPGMYDLRISGGPARLSAAFLTTYADLLYPFCGDLDVPVGSYVRFRVDQFPPGKKEISLSASFLHHTNPFFGSYSYYTPDGVREDKSQPFDSTGYTRWFRLQDNKYLSTADSGHCHMTLNIPAGAKGATQFATFPHPDRVAREFDWHEPEGTRLSLTMNFDTYLHELRTFRDHAAENYEYALKATGGRLFPLARGPLYFTTNGFANGLATDYFMQTARLLGANVGPGGGQQHRYGWWTAGAQYAPELVLPFDEAKSAEYFDDYYRNLAKTYTEDDKRTMRTFQIADEPGEYLTTQLSAPFWRYLPKEKGGPRWIDSTGGSELYTRKTDYRNCVLEGKIIKLGGALRFRVGFSDHTKADGGMWGMGAVGQRPVNFVVELNGKPVMSIDHKTMRLDNDKPMPFKIVYARDTASLYVNGIMLNRISGLRQQGGFGILGSEKAIVEMRVRPMTPEERIEALPPNNDPDAADENLIDDDEGIFADGVALPEWAKPKPLEQFVTEDWVFAGGIPGARDGFLRWLQARGVTLEMLKLKKWDDVRLLTVADLIDSESDRRLFYWSRRYSNYLTPKLFSLVNNGIQAAFEGNQMMAFVGLSGHALYFPSKMPLDMFQLAEFGNWLAPGVSDAMSYGGWRWDSHQAVAFSVAPYNAGARNYADRSAPKSPIMMHCMWPTPFRGFTQLANNVKYISYWCFGPCYLMTEWFWGESPANYVAAHEIDNSAGVTDDLLAPGLMRPSRVALLYAMATETWDPTSSFPDKRATFLGLTHDYFPAEVVSEEQIADGALKHYDALYVLDAYVTDRAQQAIEAWVKEGGLLWTCADAFRWNEYKDPSDLLQRGFGLQRTYTTEKRDTTLVPAAGETALRKQATPATPVDAVTWAGAKVRARFGDGRAAWLEKSIGKGKVVYLAFRAGSSYSQKSIAPVVVNTVDALWCDYARVPLTLPLFEAKIERELILSEPNVMASPLSSAGGTVIVLHNMQAGPLKNVKFSLKGAKAPVSVDYVKDVVLTPVPFTFTNGRVEFTLPEFDGAAMVTVRDVPAPADDRPAQMRANTVRMYASDDWQDLSAAAWFTGFHPQWQLQDKLLPLLAHAHSSVRRSAVEACGRLKLAASAGPLASLLEKEEDAHVLAFGSQSLAQLGSDRFPAIAKRAIQSPHAFTRQYVLRAAQIYLRGKTTAGPLNAAQRTFAQELLAATADDPDSRVRHEHLRLLALAEPARCLALLGTVSHAAERTVLAEIVVNNETLLATYGTKPVGDGQVLLALAQQRPDARLAKLMAAQLEELAKIDPYALCYAALTQADATLSRALFARRDILPERTRLLTMMVLDRVYGAHLGNDAAVWEEWLAQQR